MHKSHNVSVLLYHVVCPAKYRRVVINEEIERVIRETCLEIEKRWEIRFLEIGLEGEHAHFLIQSVPMYSPSTIVQRIKSLTAREVFERVPEVKTKLWGGEFWGKGYYVSTVGQHGNEKTIATYVRNQKSPNDYKQLYKQQELFLFPNTP